MNRDEITVLIDLCYILYVMNISGQIPCCAKAQVRIRTIYFHTEMNCCVSNQLSDSSETDNTKLLTREFGTTKLLLRLLHVLGDIRICCVIPGPFHTTYDITAGNEHSCEDHFFYTIRISSGSVEYNNTLVSILVEGNIVNTRTCTCNTYSLRIQLDLMHLRRTNNDCICIVYVFRLAVIRCKAIQTRLAKRVQAMIFEHSLFLPFSCSKQSSYFKFSASNFFINSTRASTPSLGIAL